MIYCIFYKFYVVVLFTNDVCVVPGFAIDRCEWQITSKKFTVNVLCWVELGALFVEGAQSVGIGKKGKVKHSLSLGGK